MRVYIIVLGSAGGISIRGMYTALFLVDTENPANLLSFVLYPLNSGMLSLEITSLKNSKSLCIALCFAMTV